MKNLKILKILLIFSLLFFSLQFFSHIFLKLGLNKENPPRSGLLEISKTLFPLDAEVVYEHAFSLLEEGTYLKGDDNAVLKDSIKGFKQAVELNPLLYQAHFNLGKAYQIGQVGGSTVFDDAFKNMKRAAIVRGINPRIGAEFVKFAVPFWPFLSMADKKFVQKVFDSSIEYMNGNDFESIARLWSVYQKDIDFFKNALIQKPVFILKAANEMEKAEVYMKQRQTLLSKYESYYLNFFKRTRMAQLSINQNKKLPVIKAYFTLFSNNIPGYFRITDNTDFNVSLYAELKSDLIIKIIGFLLEDKNKNELNEFILSFFDEKNVFETTNRVYQYLINENILNQTDLIFRFLEMRIHSKLNNWDRVMEMGEAVRQSLSFVREEQKEDYVRILLLMIQVYLKNGQLFRAEEVLEEAEGIAPDNEEVIWLRCKTLHVKGQMVNMKSEDSEVGDRISDIENVCEQIEKSRVFDIKRTTEKKTVLLMGNPILKIIFRDSFKNKIRGKHLIQVFLDGWIYYEQYLGEIGDEMEVILEGKEWEKAEVEIRIK